MAATLSASVRRRRFIIERIERIQNAIRLTETEILDSVDEQRRLAQTLNSSLSFFSQREKALYREEIERLSKYIEKQLAQRRLLKRGLQQYMEERPLMMRHGDNANYTYHTETDVERSRMPAPAPSGRTLQGLGKPSPDVPGDVPENVMKYALSEDDIRNMVGNIPIFRYPDLEKFATPDEMFNGSRAVVLLFLTEDKNTGHWITVLNHPNEIEVFDSYGVSDKFPL